MSEVRLDILFNASDVFRALDELEARLNKFQNMQLNLGTNLGFDKLTQQVGSVSNAVSRITRDIDTMVNRVQKITQKPTGDGGGGISLSQVGSLYMLSNVFDRFASRLGSVLESAFQEFRSAATALQKTRIVAGAPTPEYERFVSELRKLAPEVMIPFPDLAEIAYAFATRGYANLQTAPDVLRPLAISSLITGETLDTMARSILSLMQAWNPRSLTSLENLAPLLVRQFSDMMSYAFATSPLEVRWFKDIANYAAPLFAQLGYSPAETMALFMAMAQQVPTPGIGARSARMLMFNVRDIEKSFKIYEKYGIDAAKIFREVSAQGGNLADAFKALYSELQSLPREQLVSVFKQLGGGVRGGMAAMMLQQGELLENISTYITRLQQESIGYTSRVALQYRATPIGMFEAAEAQLSAKMSELGTAVADAKTALLDLQSSLVDFANALPEAIPAFGYGAAQGAKFSSQWVIGTLANVGLTAYLASQMSGAMSALLTGGLAAAIVIPLALGGYTAYKSMENKRIRRDLQELIDAFAGMSTVEAASAILQSYKRFRVPLAKEEWGEILVPTYNEAGEITGFKTDFLRREAIEEVIGILGEEGIALEYALLDVANGLGEGATRFRTQAQDVEAQVLETLSAMFEQGGITTQQLTKTDFLTRTFRRMGFENAQEMAQTTSNLFEKLSTQTKGLLDEEGIANAIKQLITAGVIERETGVSGLVEKVGQLFNIGVTFEDIKPLISQIAVELSDIANDVDSMASETKTDLGYAQLLDLWLSGFIPESRLETTLPALKAGDYPIERSWIPGRYADTVAVGLKVLMPEAIVTSANLDAAFKPSLVMD
ncbi:MAG: phage tail tape measure protein [Candidatus Hodarchaeales archaeon]